MNPIFDEYIEFLNHNKVNIELKQGYYWLDRQIIKVFDTTGNIHKVLRINTDNELNISFKYYPIPDNIKIESWEETYSRNRNRLDGLEKESLNLIKNSLLKYNCSNLFLLTSSGKDSQVVDYLLDKGCNLKYRTLFNNTSIDCADTYRMVKANKNITIISPDIGFYNWVVKENNIPSRINRTCCSIFKEGKTVEWLKKNGYHNTNILLFLGMRNEESNNRSLYGDEWKNDKWEEVWNGILPIRKWSELDIWLYTLHNNITINPKYKKGYSRVGCAVACPFYTKSTWALDKYWYSSMYDRWQRILKDDFIRNAKWTRMNCTIDEYLKDWNGGALRDKPNENVLLEFSKHQEIEKEIAEKYFDNYCGKCGKRILGRDLISANMKLNGRKSNIFFCKKHLKIHHNIKSEKEWKQLMLDFKNSGCNLF